MGTIIRAALLTAALAACVAQSQPSGAGPPPAQGGGATCETACQHYTQCKGDPSLYQECIPECQARQPTPAELDQFVTLDCASAIQTAEGGGGDGQGQQPAGQCNADCQGCVWDGSTCYSAHAAAGAGTVIECEACCCAKG